MGFESIFPVVCVIYFHIVSVQHFKMLYFVCHLFVLKSAMKTKITPASVGEVSLRDCRRSAWG